MSVLKIIGYGGWFLACFVFALYMTFPVNAVKGRVESEMEKALGKGKQGRYGVDPDVSIGELDLYRLSGVKAKQVTVRLGSRDPDPGPEIQLDDVAVRLGIFSYLFSDPSVSFNANAYGGSLSGGATVHLSKAKASAPQLRALDLDIDGIDLARVPAVIAKVGVPVTGKLAGTVELDLGGEPQKTGTGEIDLAINGVTLGPGEFNIPVPGLTGGLTVPLVDMGDLVVKLGVDKGMGKIEKLGLNGKDVSAELEGTLKLNKRITLSVLKLDGWLQIADQFLEQNSKFKTLLEFAQPLKAAKDDEGRYHFRVVGNLKNPKPALGSSTRSRKSKR